MTLRLNPSNNQPKLGDSGFMICPRCGDVMYPPFVSLSRIHQKVQVCSDCGGEEGLLQLAGKDAGWQPVTFSWGDMRERYKTQIVVLEADIEARQDQIERLQRRVMQQNDEADKGRTQLTKNREVIRQLQNQIAFMDEQIKTLLGNMLNPEGQ